MTIHHITAIAADPQRNYDFYHGILGLRLVKKTVNFDDPSSYHLYYGSQRADPGSLLTFFTWSHLPARTQGIGDVSAIGFAVDLQSIEFWKHRLSSHKIAFTQTTRTNMEVLAFEDFEGLRLEICGTKHRNEALRASHPQIPQEHALCGFAYVVLHVGNLALIAEVLETIGYRHVTQHANVHEFRTLESTQLHERHDLANGIFVTEMKAHPALQGIGSVHHIAFGAADDAMQLQMRERIHELDLRPTPQIDRQYFHSVYFREHNGILFEIATAGPGFTVDEPLERLGERLCLPPQYEPYRESIEAHLTPLRRRIP